MLGVKLEELTVSSRSVFPFILSSCFMSFCLNIHQLQTLSSLLVTHIPSLRLHSTVLWMLPCCGSDQLDRQSFSCPVFHLIARLFIPSLCSDISRSIIRPGCLDRSRQQSAQCIPVWPVFLLTWCYSSHSRPAQLSIWAVCVCVCESDPGPSVLSAVGAVMHISHMTAPNLALPDCAGLTSHRICATIRTLKYPGYFPMDWHPHHIHRCTQCIGVCAGRTTALNGVHIHADTLSGRLIPCVCCPCVWCSLTTVWCRRVLRLGLFELESRPIVAVKVLLDGLSRAKWGYAETAAVRRARKLWENGFQSALWRCFSRESALLLGQCSTLLYVGQCVQWVWRTPHGCDVMQSQVHALSSVSLSLQLLQSLLF